MTLSTVIYDTLRPIGSGISAAFNWASGNKALQDRGLERPNDGTDIYLREASWGMALGGAVVFAAAILFPVPSALVLAFTVVAAAEAGLAPAQLEAAYVIGKDARENGKPSLGI